MPTRYSHDSGAGNAGRTNPVATLPELFRILSEKAGRKHTSRCIHSPFARVGGVREEGRRGSNRQGLTANGDMGRGVLSLGSPENSERMGDV